VQQAEHHHGRRFGEVDYPGGSGQDGVRVPRVGVDVLAAALRCTGQQRLRVRQHDRVVVDVDDPRLRRRPLRHLVGVAGGGQAGADVEELPEAGLGRQVVHGGREERPVGRLSGVRTPDDVRSALTMM
jgi:hypothetical protein